MTTERREKHTNACRPPLESFIRLLAYTGLRWGEATALQVKRVDLMRRRLEVARTAIDIGDACGL